MTSAFQGYYYNGQSATPEQVSVEIKHKQLVLSAPGLRREIAAQALTNIERVGDNRLLIRFGTNDIELLDIRSEEFIRAFSTAFPEVKSGKNVMEHALNKGYLGIGIIVGTLLGIALLIYFVVLPWTGELAAKMFPREYEVKLGKMLFENTLKEYTIDTAKTALLKQLVKDVDFKSEYDLDIVVVKYDMMNAFAIPGGHIVVFTGILDHMKEYPELMGLLAHEVSHVNKRHSLRAMFRGLSTYIFISFILGDMNAITAIVVEKANDLKTLSFSRSLEQEADLEGLQILFHNKIDPQGMVNLFKSMMEEEKGASDQMEFLSSHPVTQNRIEYIDEKIKESTFTVVTDSAMQKVWEQLIVN